jgi:hypothetical protein
VTEDFEALMQERPDGIEPQVEDDVQLDGFTVHRDETSAGMVAHRGVLHPDEFVDTVELGTLVEETIGFSLIDIRDAYRQGPKTAAVRERRERIDARLLALSRSGGSLATMAALLGLNEKTIDRALVRARDRDVQPMVKTGVVATNRVCFIEATPDATPRRRRFSQSPKQVVGTVDLSDRAYARGFETEPGSADYWYFRKHGRRRAA